MAIDAIVRVSFQSKVRAVQAVNLALVGLHQGEVGEGPFTKVGTAAYSVNDGDDESVGIALQKLSEAISEHYQALDSLSVSVVRRKG